MPRRSLHSRKLLATPATVLVVGLLAPLSPLTGPASSAPPAATADNPAQALAVPSEDTIGTRLKP